MPGFPKPLRGTALLERREKRAAVTAEEDRIMREALDRDGGGRGIRKCRWPFCEHRSRDLPIDPCHERHRGMGGNPKLDRTTRDTLISFCRIDHGRYDVGEIDFEPQTALGTDGCVDFYEQTEGGRMELVASEERIGVSVPRA